MITKDRIIVVAAALPSVVAFGLAIAITHDLIISGIVGGVACVVSAAASLSPPVQRARLRLLRRKYPTAE